MLMIKYGSGLAPVLLLASVWVSPAAAQDTPVVTSPEACTPITAENVEACCEAIERGVFDMPITAEAKALCALPEEQRDEFFAGRLSLATPPDVPTGVTPPAPTPPATTPPPDRPRVDRPPEIPPETPPGPALGANPGNNKPVGQATEGPPKGTREAEFGFNPATGTGGTRGRGDVQSGSAGPAGSANASSANGNSGGSGVGGVGTSSAGGSSDGNAGGNSGNAGGNSGGNAGGNSGNAGGNSGNAGGNSGGNAGGNN